MKKTIILIFFLSNIKIVNAQKQLDIAYMECSYMLTYMKDTVEKTKKVKDIDLRLLIGKKYSKFYSHTNFIHDSVFFSMSRVEQENLFKNNSKGSIELSQKYPMGEKYEIYKNYEQNTIVLTDFIPETGYCLCNESNVKQEWIILKETKEIAGYKCQKAICSFRGRYYIAWFTRDISISDGPYKFGGLPGLIVKIYDTKEHYDFELYMVRKIATPIILKEFEKIIECQYQEVNLKDYIIIKRNFIKNVYVMANVLVTENGVTSAPPSPKYDFIEKDVK